MRRLGLLALAVLVAAGCAESPGRTAAAPPWLSETDPGGQLVTAISQIPALAGFDVLSTEGRRPPSTGATPARDLSSARVTLSMSDCTNLSVETGPSLLGTWYATPGVRQAFYTPRKPAAFLLIGDRGFDVAVRPTSTCSDPVAPFTADELMAFAESIAAEYGFHP